MTAEPLTSDSSVLNLRVVLDTNAIYTASAGYLLAYDTRKLIQETQGDQHLRVSWYLPQVVLDERRYQLEREAIQLRADVKKLEKVIRHTIPMDDNFIRDRVSASISEQVRENGLLVCQANPNDIDWTRLMSDAVRRTPPFDPEVEKGFRDALILEALKQLVRSSSAEPSPCRFAFVSRDGLLANATRGAGLLRVDVFESVDEVRGLINVLLSSNLTEVAVAAWQATAKEYFYNQKTGSGVFAELDIASRIKEECRDALAALPTGTDRRENEWKWLIPPGPSFIKKVHERVWWASRVKIRSQAFSSTPDTIFAGSNMNLEWNEQSTWVASGQLPPTVSLPTNSFIWPSSANSIVLPGVLPSGEPIGLVSPHSRSIVSSPIVGSDWSTNAVLIPKAENLTFLLPTRRLIARGVTTVVVSWSAAVDRQARFTEPRVESIEASGTEWENS